MNRIFGGILVLVLLVSVATDRADGQDQSGSPAEQYQTLLKKYQRGASSGGILSDEERLKFVGKAFRYRHQLGLKFVELAEKYPNDPVAVDALSQALWQVNTRPWPVELVGRDKARDKALAILQRDHIQSDKLGTVCQRFSFGFCKEYETFLHAVLDKSPHQNVRAQASLALGHFLNNRLQTIDQVRKQPKLSQKFENLYGKKYITKLKQQDRTIAGKEAEAIFEQALEKYADIIIPRVGPVGTKAKAVLFQMRHLAVGKQAADIEGRDQDGKQFKLSDYRGKVVLLDFWSEY